MSLPKDARERLIFEEFARASGIYEEGATIESREPPEPDVLFQLPSGKATAFELVEILDQDFSQSMKRSFATKDLCREYLAAMPVASREGFTSKYGNADIFLSFCPGFTIQRTKNSLPKVFQRLLEVPDGVEGDVLRDEPTLRNILGHATINRGRFVGPMFNTSEVLWVGDPTVTAIDSKMAKSYRTPHELSLLAYIETNPMLPDEVWLSAFEEYESRLTTDCQFSSIFVFDWQSRTIKRTWHRNS